MSRAVSQGAALERLTAAYRVRFDESTPAGTVRASALVRYAQDAAWVHSEALGYDRTWYAERGLTWLVRSLELCILEPAVTGVTLEVTTRVTGYRKVWARRLATIADRTGDLAAWIHTDWVMVDGRGLPHRVPEEFQRRFVVPEAGFDPVRVPALDPPDDAVHVPLAVRRGELDPMGHANNAVYIDYLEEAVGRSDAGALLLETVPRTYRGEYIASAVPAAELLGEAWPDGPGQRYRLSGRGGGDLFRGILVPRAAPTPEAAGGG